MWLHRFQFSAAAFKPEDIYKNGINRRKEKHITYVALKFVNVDHSAWLTDISSDLADSFDNIHYSKRPVGKSRDVALPEKYAFY